MPSVHDSAANAHHDRNQSRNQCEDSEVFVVLLIVAMQNEQKYWGYAYSTGNEYEQQSEDVFARSPV